MGFVVVAVGESQLGVIGGKVLCVPIPAVVGGAGPGLVRGFFQAGRHGSDAFWLLSSWYGEEEEEGGEEAEEEEEKEEGFASFLPRLILL